LQEFDWSDFHLHRFLIRGKALRCEPLARLHVHERRQKSAFNEFSAVLFPKIYAKGADG
jgi:hypothetical protein